MEEYQRAFRQLVAHVGSMLHKKPDRETLEYVYSDKLSGRSQDKKLSGVGLLQAMEEAGAFSYRHPEGLARVLADAKREDLKATVEEFMREFLHRACHALVRPQCVPSVTILHSICELGRTVLYRTR